MSTRLQYLPGFGDALREAIATTPKIPASDWKALYDVVIPGLVRSPGPLDLWCIALSIGTTKRSTRQSIRLVPPPRPIAANDCEAR